MEYLFNYFTNIIGLFRKPYCSERLPRIISLNLQVSYLVHSFIYIVLWSSTDPAENSFCQAQFTDSTWKVNVSCSVSKVRSARNNYRCYLYKISEARLKKFIFSLTTSPFVTCLCMCCEGYLHCISMSKWVGWENSVRTIISPKTDLFYS